MKIRNAVLAEKPCTKALKLLFLAGKNKKLKLNKLKLT